MPAPLPFALRQQIVHRHQQGETLVAIAQDLNHPLSTVRDWWRRFRDQGEAGLQTHYDRCGPRAPKTAPAAYQAALALKRAHPTWGAGLIRLQVQHQFPTEPWPKVRQLQRWFQQAGLQPPRAKRPPVPRQRAQQAHDVWQVDAKEGMHLADGTPTSVLTVTDEATGAILAVTPFPPVSLEPGAAAGGAAGVAGTV
jgi:transposase